MNAQTTIAAPPKKLLTREEAASYLGLRPQTLAKWALTKQHGLPVVKMGRAVRYRLSDLDRFIEVNTEV